MLVIPLTNLHALLRTLRLLNACEISRVFGSALL